MKPKKRITQSDYIKANRIASREAEIENHGHPVCHKMVHKSKKIYDRKRKKAGNEDLPFFFFKFKCYLEFAILYPTSKYTFKSSSIPSNFHFTGS